MDATTVSAFFNSLLDLAGSIALGAAGIAVAQISLKIKAWFDKRTVQDAVQTATGSVMLQLAAGTLALKDVTQYHPAVTTLAAGALNRVAGAAASLGGVTAASIAQLVVGAVGKALQDDPTVPTVLAVPRFPTIPAPPPKP